MNNVSMDMSIVRFQGYVLYLCFVDMSVVRVNHDVSVTRDYNYASICGQKRYSFQLENITCESCGPFVWEYPRQLF